jgi:xanthine dehydrogenase small subunit
VTSDCIRIGSALPLTDIARAWRDAPAAAHQWLELFASPPIRNRATLGGNLATASPIGDSAPLLLALDATIHVAGTDGRRSIPISSFFAGYRQTTLDAGELVTTIEIPKPLPTHLRFYKVSKRRLDDISTVAAAFAIDGDEDDRVRRARVAFGGVGPTAVRVIDAEAAIVGRRSADVDVARIQDIFATSLTPMSDHRGSREYRLQVAQALVDKFFWEISE